MLKFRDKAVGETAIVEVDFSRLVQAGDSISSVSVSVFVLSGIDANASALLSGMVSISGKVVRQKLAAGVDGVEYAITFSAVMASGQTLNETGLLSVVDSQLQKSLLFVRDVVLSEIRRGPLKLSSASYGVIAKIDDDILWQKLQAAEADLQRRLCIPLVPTRIFMSAPSGDDISALNGMPYLVEPGYDLTPDFFAPGNFGCFRLRQTPVISVLDMWLIYPNQGGANFQIPNEWLKIDYKYGTIHVFPSAKSITAPISLLTMQAIGAGYTVPYMIRCDYVAGIDTTTGQFPDVLDLVKRMTVLRLLQDGFLPQSESVSGDGLSQSISADIGKLSGDVDDKIDTLKTRLAGPVWGVM